MLELYVVGARPYSFQDKESGRQVEGVNVYHLTTSEDSVGQIPSKITLPYDAWASIKTMQFPDTCNAITTQQITSKGIVTKVSGLQPLKK